MSVNQRIKILYESLNVKQKEFSESIKQNRATINNIVNNLSKPSYKVIEAIISTYPNLNANWLIAGDGPMWKEGSEEAILEEANVKARGAADKLTKGATKEDLERRIKIMERLMKFMEREIRKHDPELADELELD